MSDFYSEDMGDAQVARLQNGLFKMPDFAGAAPVELLELPAVHNMDNIGPLTGTAMNNGDPTPSQNPIALLARYRAQFPNIQIMQVPRKGETFLLPSQFANERSTFIPFGGDAVFVEFKANAPFFISFDMGGFGMPSAIGAGNQTQCIYAPEGRLFYVKGMQGVDALAVNPNTYLSVIGYGTPGF